MKKRKEPENGFTADAVPTKNRMDEKTSSKNVSAGRKTSEAVACAPTAKGSSANSSRADANSKNKKLKTSPHAAEHSSKVAFLDDAPPSASIEKHAIEQKTAGLGAESDLQDVKLLLVTSLECATSENLLLDNADYSNGFDSLETDGKAVDRGSVVGLIDNRTPKTADGWKAKGVSQRDVRAVQEHFHKSSKDFVIRQHCAFAEGLWQLSTSTLGRRHWSLQQPKLVFPQMLCRHF